jgi:hypothetical protein
MSPYLQKIERELSDARLLSPIVVGSNRCSKLSKEVASLLPTAEIAENRKSNLMGRDVVLVHSGEMGWEEALEHICQQSPGKLYVVAPELPRAEALKLEWVADHVIVGEETFTYEVHELGLSA